MLNDKQIKAAIRDFSAADAEEKVLNDGAAGRGGGSLRLRLRRNAGGVSAVWLGFWKSSGKRQSKQLGRYPEMSLAQARDAFADGIRQVLQAGRSPRAVVTAAERPTVEALFDAYAAHLEGRGAASAPVVRRTLLTGRYAAARALGGDRLAGSIEPGEIAAVLAKGFERGSRRQTDVCRSMMAAAFAWGLKSTHDYRAENRRDWGLKFNPVLAVPRDTEANRTRDRNLNADELRAVWNSAPDQTGDVLRLVIACGQRVLETIKAEGSEIDLEARMWNMPAHKTKGRRRPHSIPLPRQAVDIFTKLKSLHGEGPLFPARKGAKVELLGVPSVSRSAARLTCCAPFQPRDLRRTWKSRAHDAGIDRFTRDLIQQHAMNSDTGSRHYDRSNYGPQMREAMDKWELWLSEALTERSQDGAV